MNCSYRSKLKGLTYGSVYHDIRDGVINWGRICAPEFGHGQKTANVEELEFVDVARKVGWVK